MHNETGGSSFLLHNVKSNGNITLQTFLKEDKQDNDHQLYIRQSFLKEVTQDNDQLYIIEVM